MSRAKYLRFSKDEIKCIVEGSTSVEEVLEKMQYTLARNPSSINSFKQYCTKINIDISALSDMRELIQCGNCKQFKTIDAFYLSQGKVAQKTCKECVCQKERDKYRKKQDKINDIKKCNPCMKCGCSKFYLIDFHHLDPSQKDYTISDNTHAKPEIILEEIKKCIPLCANCHREFHYLARVQKLTIEEYLDGRLP